jgi:acylphosphatase
MERTAAECGDVAVKFVIRGKVQGVFFRKHTLAKASELRLKGDVRNVSDGSVQGVIQGAAAAVHSMKMCAPSYLFLAESFTDLLLFLGTAGSAPRAALSAASTLQNLPTAARAAT